MCYPAPALALLPSRPQSCQIMPYGMHTRRRLLGQRQVPTALQDHRLSPRYAPEICLGMGRGDDAILRSPDNQRWRFDAVQVARQLGVIGELPGKTRQRLACP